MFGARIYFKSHRRGDSMKYWAKVKGRDRKAMVAGHSESESKGPDTLVWVCLFSPPLPPSPLITHLSLLPLKSIE